jgi:DMSO/TMAO reductase YedYZ molybdopterin-dependent catalytic subunit
MADDLPEDSKLTRSKRRWAEEGRFLTGRHARPHEERLPPGQHLVQDWPVLDLGRQPDVSLERWSLRLFGLVEEERTLDWSAFTALPQTQERSDIHCVTSWSRYDNDWSGVSTRTLLDLVRPLQRATAVMLHSYDGYTTNVRLDDFAAPDALIAAHWSGQPITRAHGGPARLILPHLYFWKSAKWLGAIEFIDLDRPGFWESNGYHIRGDPWAEERYSSR